MQQWLESTLQHSVFNPNLESEKFFQAHYPDVDFRKLKKTNISEYQSIVRRLVEIDCEEIASKSDYVICYWDEGAVRGAGTKGELTVARYFGKDVYLVSTYPPEDIPGWVLGCVTEVFSSFDELRDFLSKLHRQISGF